nr:MAG TPA: hypothetical protein [Caudoviricetes sp.]
MEEGHLMLTTAYLSKIDKTFVNDLKVLYNLYLEM